MTRLKEVIIYVSNCDEKAAENIVEHLLKIWYENEVEEVSNQANNHKNNNNDSKSRSESDKLALADELATIGINNPAEYAINVTCKLSKVGR
jgi:predicted  nucleic acid-binding Zn-ribbon protein